MADTQTIITENSTTVIARIRIVPMTSDTPDSPSRRMVRMRWPPGGLRENTLAPDAAIYKLFVVVTNPGSRENHGARVDRPPPGRGAVGEVGRGGGTSGRKVPESAI